MDRRAAGHRPAAGPARSTVLTPPRVLRCGALVSGRRMLQVGVRGSSAVGAELRDGAGTVLSRARFAHGRRGRWTYAAAGPYRCGASYVVAYRARGAETTFPVSVAAAATRATTRGRRAGPRRSPSSTSSMAAFAVLRGFVRAAATTARPRAARTCASKPQQAFAHGGDGPVDHRFHARPAISASGRIVAYDLPAAGLVPGDRNGARDVFVRDASGGPTRLVSAALGGGAGNGGSRAAAISADGRYVAFESFATDLVAADRDGERDIFVRNLRAGTTRLVAPGRSPTLSGDGAIVAFEAAGGVSAGDLRSGAVRRVAPSGYRPALSADGRFVAYESRRALSSDDGNRDWDVYRTRLSTGATVLLNAGAGGRSLRGASLAAVLSADGSAAAFQSDAALVRGDREGLRDVLVRDVAARRTVLASANRCGRPADGYSRYPSISADGRRVAFDSHATDLVSGAPRGRGQAYLRDLGAHRTILLSATPAGRASSRTSFSPALAARAAVAAFASFAYDLGPRDANQRVDIYRRNTAAARTQRISRR
jgi:Tol biopolymer transport system component